MNNVEAKLESESEAEDPVVEGDDARQKSGAGGTTETTVEGAPTQLRQLIWIKCVSVRDDPHFSTISYSHQKLFGDLDEPENQHSP